jgi:hypothetical protein
LKVDGFALGIEALLKLFFFSDTELAEVFDKKKATAESPTFR